MVGESGTIVAKLNGLKQWMFETSTAGLSLRALDVAYGGGGGNTHLVRTPAGPFLG